MPIDREVKEKGRASNTALCAADGKAEGKDLQAEIMIPTLMARHRAKRPAMSMEGGTKLFLRSGPPRRRLTLAFEKP